MTKEETTDLPSRTDAEYDKEVLSAGVGTFADAKDDAAKKKALDDELVTCHELVGAWSDCNSVVQDCEVLLDTAQTEVSKSNADFVLAHKKLLEVRQRLAQAWRSGQNKRLVIGLSAWLVIAFVFCVFALVWWRLLPGWAPKLATTNANVAFALSSFVIGAIGGIFDAAWSVSKNYSEQRFDRSHGFWYITSPFLGGIIGAVVFMMFVAGFISTTGTGIGTENITGGVAASSSGGIIEFSAKTAGILAIVFLAGFKQITVVDWFEGIALAVFNRGSQSGTQSKGNS